ncbi:MAG: peptide-methionine (R)-S-oxide reductase MsrB [Rhodospirillaceae bacterium]|nr:MAG: peptide-methionine (R)-S-oxide reductase MsrB [Rhodospirillaceae bacterium]
MLSRRMVLSGTVFGLAGAVAFWRAGSLQAGSLLAQDTAAADTAKESFAVTHSEAEWRKLLSADQYAVLREAATERPFSSPLLHEERRGNFDCAGCDLALFSSTTKFDSGTGWPSFWAPLENAVGTTRDTAFGMVRTAVHCSRCGGHLGHVFDDGPQPTGLRYCMNGLAMTFKAVAA